MNKTSNKKVIFYLNCDYALRKMNITLASGFDYVIIGKITIV
jgi:hypothetical protein